MKKLNNKGFSLVELIIVIAIMVILVAVLAPQFTKWVERSRVSTDFQTASEIATAVEVAIAEGKLKAGDSAAVTSSNIGAGKTLEYITAVPSTKSSLNGGKNQSFTYTVGTNLDVTISVTGNQEVYPTPGAKYDGYYDKDTTE